LFNTPGPFGLSLSKAIYRLPFDTLRANGKQSYAYAASCVMQPLIGHTFTHCGLSYSPSHSVHSLALMMYNPFFTLMEAVGHSGSQSPQEVHKSVLIFIAIMILLSM
jgi:hypothetical protein